jgi:hypothetical protein
MQMQKIVEADRNPLTVLADWVLDDTMDVQVRLSAASICLPYLFPRLSQTTVDARHTVERVDSADLVQRISDRIAKLAPPEPATVVIEADADDAATPVEDRIRPIT